MLSDPFLEYGLDAPTGEQDTGCSVHLHVEGAVLVGTILFWTYAIERLAHRFPTFERFLRPQTLLLIEDGKMLRNNMRAELSRRKN